MRRRCEAALGSCAGGQIQTLVVWRRSGVSPSRAVTTKITKEVTTETETVQQMADVQSNFSIYLHINMT